MSRSVENVIKQGYLKKGNAGGNRIAGLLRKIEGQKWFVFTIRSGIPYLEYYDNDTEMFSQRPINSYCLDQCQNVTSMGRTNPPTFSISCSDRYIELIASTRNQMLEWVRDIENTLTRLGVIKKECGEHVYTVLPAVIRQPRVSQEVVEERQTMAGAQSARPPKPLSPAPSLPPDPPPVADSDEPPPLPHRPPPRANVRDRQIESSEKNNSATASGQATTVQDATNVFSSSPSQINCNNDSDFVSWDVVMQVRENFLRNSRILHGKTPKSFDNGAEGYDNGAKGFDYGAEGFDDSEMSTRTNFSDDESENGTDYRMSVFGDFTPSSVDLPKRKMFGSDDGLDVSTLPSNYSPFPNVGSQSEMSFNMENISKKVDTEENEYSLLPGRLRDEEHEKTEMEEEVKLAAKPIPLPRRLKVDPRESSHLRNGTRDDSETRNLLQMSLEEDFRDLIDLESISFLNTLGDLDSESDILNGSNDAKSSENKDENENFYDSKNSKSHSVLAPPSIPPRCVSLMSGTTQTMSLSSHSNQDSNTCDSNNVYSHPISSSSRAQSFVNRSSHSSKVMSIPSMDLSSNKENTSEPPAIPPLPLPRRTATKKVQSAFNPTDKPSNAAAASMDIPKLPPRRFLPRSLSLQQDLPPVLPSRNSRGCSMTKTLLLACSSISECSEKGSEKGQQMWKDGPYSKPNKSATLGAAAGARQSGLSKKMLLDRANSLHTVVSLKQTQADILQGEIDKSHVNVTLTQKSGHGLALVDWNSMPCVAGWNQKDFPSLHGKLHIGDMIISVNNVRVTSSATAQKLLKHASESRIEVMLQRMPYAKVFAIRRSAEGQSLGLKREGGTAEILYVDPNGLAADHGLPQYALGTMGGKTRCTWFLTEINSRPLNLFFKENEIEHRLYAVGREISIVVQPSDFIFEIRSGLKKLKNHKSYITQ